MGTSMTERFEDPELPVEDDQEFWFAAGIDVAHKRWENWELLTNDELRELGRMWIKEDRHDQGIRDVEAAHPELERKVKKPRR